MVFFIIPWIWTKIVLNKNWNDQRARNKNLKLFYDKVLGRPEIISVIRGYSYLFPTLNLKKRIFNKTYTNMDTKTTDNVEWLVSSLFIRYKAQSPNVKLVSMQKSYSAFFSNLQNSNFPILWTWKRIHKSKFLRKVWYLQKIRWENIHKNTRMNTKLLWKI